MNKNLSNENDHNEQEIREMFARAREADRSTTPSFRTMVSTRPPTRRLLPVGWTLALGSALTLAMVGWLVVKNPAPIVPPVASPQPVTDERDELLAKAREATSGSKIPVVEQKQNESGGRVDKKIEAVAAKVDAGAATAPAPFVKDLPILSERAHQDALSLAPESNCVNPDSIEEIEIITASATGANARAQGEFSWTVQLPAEGEGGRLNTESYAPIRDNELQTVRENPLSTFSIDVDTASYANVRRFLKSGTLPPRDAVRVEELVNYFRYDYPPPMDDAPFSASVEVASCPWNEAHRLARIGLKGKDVQRGASKGSNLVFLIDVSGSMDAPAKLPLLQKSLGLLVDELDGRDDVAIVVYAGASGVVLPPTPGSAKAEIRAALDRLQAGGSTNGGAGLQLAYKLARERFIRGGINRVILATDGDWNVGVTTQAELYSSIEADAKNGVFLTVLGFGMGNYKDSMLEQLADRGNGNYAYIDDLREARKVLVEEIGGTLVTIAKDVKIQVEFNPAQVAAYRLVGYENRLLRKEDFNNDRKDAGEIGSGHTVTALYEIVPAGSADEDMPPPVDALKYQAQPAQNDAAPSDELFTVKLRYKEPEGDKSRLLSFPVTDSGHGIEQASADLEFAAAVADFGLLLRQGPKALDAGLSRVRSLALAGAARDEGGYRAELVELLDLAGKLASAGNTGSR